MNKNRHSISELEKFQITQSTFKRNKQYLDFNKIQQEQKNLQLKRRKPLMQAESPKSQRIDRKIHSTFRNSIEQLNLKLQEATRKFKDRMSPQHIKEQPQTQPQSARTTYFLENPQKQYSQTKSFKINSEDNFEENNNPKLSPQKQKNSESPQKIKGISIQKQLTRQYLYRYNVEKKLISDQRLFNNFYITKHDLSKTQDFKKKSLRKIDFVLKNLNDIQYNNTQKHYQSFYFDNKPMKCQFNYDLSQKMKTRKFFIPQRPQNLAATDLQPEKIFKSFTAVSNFKPNKIDPFYRISGRNLPNQLDQRKLSPNCNFYKDKDGRILKQEVDYSLQKLKDDMIKINRQERKRKKNPQFTRNQVCDQRYFKQMMKKEKLLAELNNV